LLQKDKIIETADAQNSTFANRYSRHETKVCKRAVFLPTLGSQLITLWKNNSETILKIILY